MKFSSCVVALCLSLVSAQTVPATRKLQKVADMSEMLPIAAEADPETYIDKNGQVVAKVDDEPEVPGAAYTYPPEGTIINAMEFALIVESDPGETNVYFQLDDPDGNSSDWMEGEHEPGHGIYSVKMSSYLGPGTYKWRFKATTGGGLVLTSEATEFEIDQEATPFGHLKSLIAANIVDDQGLADDYVALGVEDCASRCDGCVDLVNKDDTLGLDSVIDSLQEISKFADEEYGISRADVWTLASLVGAEMSPSNAKRGDTFPMVYQGRINCEEVIPYCPAPNGGPQIMCGPKAAPDYGGEAEGLGAMSISSLDLKNMDAKTLSGVQEAGDQQLMTDDGCDGSTGPCFVFNS